MMSKAGQTPRLELGSVFARPEEKHLTFSRSFNHTFCCPTPAVAVFWLPDNQQESLSTPAKRPEFDLNTEWNIHF